MNKLNSEIRGQANIVFGGKVGSSLSKLTIEEPNIVIRIGELELVQTIGIVEENRKYKNGFQVNMVFSNIESIKAVRKWLDLAEEKLQNQLEGKKWNE